MYKFHVTYFVPYWWYSTSTHVSGYGFKRQKIHYTCIYMYLLGKSLTHWVYHPEEGIIYNALMLYTIIYKSIKCYINTRQMKSHCTQHLAIEWYYKSKSKRATSAWWETKLNNSIWKDHTHTLGVSQKINNTNKKNAKKQLIIK